MLIQQKVGNIRSFEITGMVIDTVPLEWYEVNKRILHKSSVAGTRVTLKFLKEDPAFSQGDIVFVSDELVIMIDILPTDSIVITPSTMHEMASLCYEIGNKHLPLFVDNDVVLVPYEEPLFRWLTVSGFRPFRELRKLLTPLKTTTMAHSHVPGSSTLFSKIMQLTKNLTDEQR